QQRGEGDDRPNFGELAGEREGEQRNAHELGECTRGSGASRRPSGPPGRPPPPPVVAGGAPAPSWSARLPASAVAEAAAAGAGSGVPSTSRSAPESSETFAARAAASPSRTRSRISANIDSTALTLSGVRSARRILSASVGRAVS